MCGVAEWASSASFEAQRSLLSSGGRVEAAEGLCVGRDQALLPFWCPGQKPLALPETIKADPLATFACLSNGG